MWDMLLSFLPIMLVILGILIVAIVTLKFLEARRNAKLKREYEAQQKKGDIFQKLKKCTGIDRLHPHLLRHTFATNYLVDGGDLETLRLILGHSDLQVTSMYLHLAQNKRLLQSKHRSHLDYMVNNERIDTNEEHTKVNQIDRRNLQLVNVDVRCRSFRKD